MRQKVKEGGAKLKTVFVPNCIRWTPELNNPIFEAEILEATFVISPNILKIAISCNQAITGDTQNTFASFLYHPPH